MGNLNLIRTNSENIDFKNLVEDLEQYLAEIDGEEHSFYAQYNQLSQINHCVILYVDGCTVSCGAFKFFENQTVEIKRMYTKTEFRGRNFARMILIELENWALEEGFSKCILETGKRQKSAVKLYQKQGCNIIPNYGQYAEVENSICFEKVLKVKWLNCLLL